MKFNQKKFNQFVIDEEIIGFFGKPVNLVSGRTSSWYVNWRNGLYDAVLLDTVSDFLLAFIKEKKLKVECFYGIPDGTTKLAIVSQYKLMKKLTRIPRDKYVFAMGRKTPKDHGDPKDRFFVGQPKGNVVVIEDVTTTGESVLKHVKIMRDFGVNVLAAVTLTNRNAVRDNGKSIAQELAELDVPYYALSTALELLPQIVKKKKPSKSIQKAIIEEFKTYGEKEIEL